MRFSHPHDYFSVNSGLRGESAPVHRAEIGVRRERPEKEEEKEEFEEEGSKEDGEKAPAAKRRKVPKSQYNVLPAYTKITCCAVCMA